MKKRHKKNAIGISKVFFLIFIYLSVVPIAFGEDYSGTYACLIEGDEDLTGYLQIEQTGINVLVSVSWGCPWSGSVSGGVMTIAFGTIWTMELTFSQDGQDFSGTWQYMEMSGTITGNRVGNEEWPGSPCYDDIDSKGVPRFVENDFTELDKISEISRFRSGSGHDFSDDFESCRSMKHYYYAFEAYRENGNLKVYSPVDGVIDSIIDEQHGSSAGLSNKQIRIRSIVHPGFTFVIFHTDLLSSNITEGIQVQAGQLLAHAHMYYPDLQEYAPGFDIAVWINTPGGMRYVSYFETLTCTLSGQYVARGAQSRDDFIISKEERDADPLTCDGEQFLTTGSLSNWVTLRDASLFHPSDPDVDYVVGDFELLNYIDMWARCDVGDFDLLDTIDLWAAGQYYWDESEKKFKPGEEP